MNQQYPLFAISLFVLFCYFITLLFSKKGIISVATHRKIWNVLLLITFLMTGIIGFFAIIKINYKFEVSFYETLLTLHVDFGIGMFLISIFHFSWHIKYYLNLFAKKKALKLRNHDREKLSFPHGLKPLHLHLLLFLLGFITLVVQILFFREFIVVIGGNEFISAVLLAMWLLITATGNYIARMTGRASIQKTMRFFLLISILPGILIFLLYYFKNLLYPPGVLINVSDIILFSFLFLLPFCFISGWLFNNLSSLLSEYCNSNQIAKAYGLESVGSVIAGLVFSLMLVYVFNTYQVLGIVVLVTVGILCVIYYQTGKRSNGTISLLIGLLIGSLFISLNVDREVKSLIFNNQQVIKTKDTPYGNLTVTKLGDETTIYENGVVLQSTSDFMNVEEIVHFAMAQHPHPKNVMIMSGNLEAQLLEVEKYNVMSVDYVELNSQILKIKQTAIQDSNVNVIHDDPFHFLKKTDKVYDILIINSPSPGTIESNRYYSVSFYEMIKKHCNSRTVIITSLSTPLNYLGEESKILHSVVYRTLKNSFSNVLVMQGEKNYYLASESALTSRVCDLLNEKNIENQYVNEYYLSDDELQQRSDFLLDEIDITVPINTNLNMTAFQSQLKIWLSYFKVKYKVFFALLLIVFFFIFFKISAINRCIYTGGFTATASELVILFSFQVFFGNFYQMLGIIFAVFMAGLSAGAMFSKGKLFIKNSYSVLSKIQFAVALTCLILPLILYIALKTQVHGTFLFLSLMIITFLMSFLVGTEFKLASNLLEGNYGVISSRVYGFDLLGAALGALMLGVFLVPILGILNICFVLVLLNLLSGVMVWVKR